MAVEFVRSNVSNIVCAPVCLYMCLYSSATKIKKQVFYAATGSCVGTRGALPHGYLTAARDSEPKTTGSDHLMVWAL